MKLPFKVLITTALLSSMAAASIVATVDGTQITSDEVNQVLMEGTQGRFNTLPKAKQDELRKRIVEGMIAQELVYADAKKSGVLTSKEYKDELAEVMKRVEKQLASKVWEKQQFDKIKVSDTEIKKYFDSHANEFVEKEKVHARHILVKTEEEAKNIIDDLKAKQGDALKTAFAEAAKKFSTGPSGPKGGDLGSFPRGQMVPEFNDKVFSMTVGTITAEPVKTQFGYHIIYLEDKIKGKKLSFDEVKSFIEQKLKMEKFKEAMEQKMKALTDAAKITYGK
ncbi:peptidylprolyl isomerase [Sulfurimonas sp. HSL3-7]|uniref:peptidylprolyl isomerase n=1 Tax=Sulfonitrofixus jiaomeiensis TaxID=3131938 RepID=UPI0031F8158F